VNVSGLTQLQAPKLSTEMHLLSIVGQNTRRHIGKTEKGTKLLRTTWLETNRRSRLILTKAVHKLLSIIICAGVPYRQNYQDLSGCFFISYQPPTP